MSSAAVVIGALRVNMIFHQRRTKLTKQTDTPEMTNGLVHHYIMGKTKESTLSNVVVASGAGCVWQWFRTAEPLREHRYENWKTHTHSLLLKLRICDFRLTTLRREANKNGRVTKSAPI